MPLQFPYFCVSVIQDGQSKWVLGDLDTCSDTNFITKAVKDELKLTVIKTSKVKTSSIEGSLPKKDLPAHI